MTEDIKILLAEFNRNVEWLKKNQQLLPNQSSPYETDLPDYLYMQDAKRVLQRGRTWITWRMITPDDLTPDMNTNWFLIYGLDWHREGSKIMFKKDSIMRLKKELKSMGNRYQHKTFSRIAGTSS